MFILLNFFADTLLVIHVLFIVIIMSYFRIHNMNIENKLSYRYIDKYMYDPCVGYALQYLQLHSSVGLEIR